MKVKKVYSDEIIYNASCCEFGDLLATVGNRSNGIGPNVFYGQYYFYRRGTNCPFGITSYARNLLEGRL